MKESAAVKVGRYLAGEMNERERTAFEDEMAADQVLWAEYLAYKRIWNSSKFDAQETWSAENAISKWNQTHPPQARSQRTGHLVYWAIAASILIVVGAVYFLFLKPAPQQFLYTETGAAPITLQDGSKIYLNKGGAVTVYPFSRKKRHVSLSGEAYFEIHPDAERLFTIVCGNTMTEVVGTAFMLRQSGDEVSLHVTEGKVIFRLNAEKGQALALTSGEAARYAADKISMIPNPSPNANAWHTQQLQFDKMPLSSVLQEVGDYFGKTIIVDNPDIKSCRITILRPFKQPEIEKVLNAVALSVNAKVVEKDGMYTIVGGNCK